MRTKRSRIIVIAIGLCLAMAMPALVAAQPLTARKDITIGMVFDGPWIYRDAIQTAIQQEIRDILGNERQINFPAEKILVADWTIDGARAAVQKLLSDPAVHIVLSMGPLTSHAVGQAPSLPKPVLAPFVIDAELQGLPVKEGRSGRKNFSYLTVPWSFERDLQVFREITPFTKLAIIGSQITIDVLPGLRDRILASAAKAGVELVVLPVGAKASDALDRIPAGVEAVYVAPLLQFSAEQHEALIQGLIARKLPSFSQIGRAEVERGFLAGTRPDSDFKRLARRLAVHVQRILLGDDAGTLPVSLQLSEQLVINMATARAIGLWPSWAVLTEAELVKDSRADTQRTLTLADAMREATQRNIDLAAARAVLAGSEQDVRKARAALLPTVELSATGLVIDEESADASGGSQPQFSVAAGLTVSQVLYAEGARTGYAVQKQIAASRAHEVATTQLDTVQAAAVAYLNVLRAKTLERIQQNNLRVTRKNLDLSRTRLSVGTANRAEVYRWESQIANDRKSVIDASAQRNLAEIDLNRLLDRPVEDPYATVPSALDDPLLLTSQKQLLDLMRDPWVFKTFRRFMIEEALSRSPELKQLDATIVAQERALAGSKRAFFAPTVALQGSVDQRLWAGGAGSDPNPIMLPDGSTLLGERPTFTWSVALVASVPLYSGGSQSADIKKAEAELSRLRLIRRSAEAGITQRIDAAMHLMGASFAGIRLSGESAEAAAKNLQLVTDAYAQGAVSILGLIDAQNAALVAEQVAANAVYDFLIDWMNVQRAVGQFDVLMDESARAGFFHRASRYVAAERAKVQ